MGSPAPPPRPPSSPSHTPPRLRRLRRLVHLLDEAVRIPGTKIRVGLDPLLGLAPWAGDVVGGLLTGWVVVEAARLGTPPSVVVRMLGNLALDALFGAVPALGDLFDAGWKANVRNLELLEEHVERPETARARSRTVVGLTVAGVLGIVGGVAALAAWLFSLVWGLIV